MPPSLQASWTPSMLMAWQILNICRLLFVILAWALTCYRFSMALVARMYAARKLSAVQDIAAASPGAPLMSSCVVISCSSKLAVLTPLPAQ